MAIKVYVLIKDWVDTGHAVNTACHAGAMIAKNWPRRAPQERLYDPVINEWWDTSFRKVTCKVTEQQFEKAKEYADWFPVTEMAFDNKEVALVFKPREEWPRFFKFLTLWK